MFVLALHYTLLFKTIKKTHFVERNSFRTRKLGGLTVLIKKSLKKSNNVAMEIYGFSSIFKMAAKIVKNTKISILSSIILIKFNQRGGK